MKKMLQNYLIRSISSIPWNMHPVLFDRWSFWTTLSWFSMNLETYSNLVRKPSVVALMLTCGMEVDRFFSFLLEVHRNEDFSIDNIYRNMLVKRYLEESWWSQQQIVGCKLCWLHHNSLFQNCLHHLYSFFFCLSCSVNVKSKGAPYPSYLN